MLFRILTVAVLMISLLSACTAPGTTAGTTADTTKAQQQTAAQTGSRSTQPQTTDAQALITEEEAKNIALEHAGFTADQVTGLRVELEYDHGRQEYDVSFREGYWEYDYEIDAQSGQILSFEKDD